MSKLSDATLYYEETADKVTQLKHKIFRKKDKDMNDKVETKKPSKVNKKKMTLSIYTYLNWKRFGVSVAIDNGIKINILWFETNIKFEKM